jgi:hemoglobin-like flavoprotein
MPQFDPPSCPVEWNYPKSIYRADGREMTDEQKRLVQKSWVKVVPFSDRAARLFYDRLFETNPEFRALFPADMTEQWRKLMLTVGVAIAGLDNLDEIVPAVQAMGRRHVSYGVKAEDYAPVGAALLWALEKTLGHGFTLEEGAAWAVVYDLLTTTMQEAAAS